MSQRVSVIPGIVKLRGVLIAAGCLGVLSLPWLLLPAHPRLAALLQGALFVPALYALWCYWPDFTLGIGPQTLGALPCPAEQRVRLSFDDGPTPGLTDAVLDLLLAHGVRASFFVLLPKARQHPQLIARILAEGHVLGLHGKDHRPPFFRSAAELETSLEEARAELAQLAARPITLYRPSHGWKTLWLVLAVRRAGLRLCFWDRGVWDTDDPPQRVLLQRLQQVTPRGGPPPVILLHDGLGDLDEVPPHAAALLWALGAWLPQLRAQQAPARAPAIVTRRSEPRTEPVAIEF